MMFAFCFAAHAFGIENIAEVQRLFRFAKLQKLWSGKTAE